ncbi:hypothetical protein QJS10_CPB18g01380 [Acorus calamus]|uniref:Uncharacterized protein n=1 Tax=Acorus calamus TaxID=4465 RepID=A0AAV9CIX3_ACOCL|nr:hypothetical protein QJS10_CPB18g01380 [Acorus calamus]
MAATLEPEVPVEDMEVEVEARPEAMTAENPTNDSGENGTGKRGRSDEEEEKKEEVEGEDGLSEKKPRLEKSVEEERLENLKEGTEEGNGGGEEEKAKVAAEAVSLGPKRFTTSVEMFDYFYKFLHHWPPNVDINKYEYMVLLELLKKGHLDPESKIKGGIHAFQVRYHPMWKSRCFFLIRADESVDDFSFRKCVDKILPLPENMKPHANPDGGKGFHGKKGHTGGGRGGGGGFGGRGGRGRGRGNRGGFTR